MPEIKHNFTGGKMNKDVDQRLVPKGEYRDAMNIQVSTSEGSDVGTVQNILGNSAVVNNLGISQNSICVGSIADEKNDALYWFVTEDIPHLLLTAHPLPVGTSPNFGNPLKAASYILKHQAGQISIVFTDITHKRAMSTANPVINAVSITFSFPSHNFVPGDIIDTIQVPGNVLTGLGLLVFSTTSTSITMNVGPTTNLSLSDLTSLATASVSLCNVIKPSVLNFKKDVLITGINILDDMLFWTDGVTEPKKINIPRSIEGTISSNRHTKLINNVQGINAASNILVEEEHVTVIRKAPLKAPSLEIKSTAGEGLTSGENVVTSNNSAPFDDIIIGTQVSLHFANVPNNPFGFKVGDIMLLSDDLDDLPSGWKIRASIVSTPSIYTNSSTFVVKIETIAPLLNSLVVEWYGHLEQEESLFQRKLPRFAYRYKYEDGEYSSFSPFTEVAFVPGGFDYEGAEAYNKGVVNSMKSLKIQNFVTQNTPLDVVGIDLLYKNETNPSVYLLKSVAPNDTPLGGESQNYWNTSGSYDGNGGSKGSYEVSSESIMQTLPSSQSLRVWDNVPRKALAQDITGNRIVYGNYAQGYNTIQPNIEAWLGSRDIDPDANMGEKSVKSLRDYDIGVVWGDKYGRETPVKISGSLGSIKVPKSKSANSNYINVSLENSPDWAEYYRVYVKETSNEYYNLPADRVYDAADGNVWVSFPSVDRNKVDEDTYIILKKGPDSEEMIIEEARYKIVAIENEAPEYIKTTFNRLARTNSDGSKGNHSCNLYKGVVPGATCQFPSGANAPFPGRKGFSINGGLWSENPHETVYVPNSQYLGMQLTSPKVLFDEVIQNNSGSTTDELYVSFAKEIPNADGDMVPQFTERYHVVSVEDQEVTQSNGLGYYYINLDKAIRSKDSFITDVIGLTNDNIHVHFWKKTITNKPEFDGRFFIKIKLDTTIQNNLIKTPSAVNGLMVLDSFSLYKITEGTIGSFQESTGSGRYMFHPSDSTTSAPGNVTTNSKGEWEQRLKFGGSTRRSGWFIDNATFASIQNGGQTLPSSGKLGYNNVSTTITDGNSRKSCDTTTFVSQKVTGLWYPLYLFGGSESTAISLYNLDTIWGININTQSCGDGLSNGQVAMRGVHTRPTGDKYIDIAYSQFGPDGPGSDGKSQDYKLDWRIGDPSNSSTDQEDSIVNNLKTSTLFRVNGSDVVYEILGVSKFRLFNYHGAKRSGIPKISANVIPLHGTLWNTTHRDQVKEMRRKQNRRITYRIQYEVSELFSPDAFALGSAHELDTVGEPIADITSNSNSNKLIQFLGEFAEEGENLISTNPAIFETEPKEDTDIDIYYEASSSLPTLPITEKNKHLFIPIGSTIIPPVNTDFPEGIFVSSWALIDPFSPIYNISLSTHLDLATDFFYLDSQPIIYIEKDNGEIASFEIFNKVIDPSSGMVKGLIINPKNEVGLNWFNCWSFNNGVESNRIGDTYNKPYITNGVTVSSSTEELKEEEVKKNGLIYSGLYNSTSDVNNLNQFIAAEKITKNINPTYGSIQKLHSGWGQGGDLIALCEDRVLKILANKDALYNADGNTNVTSTNNVLGQAIPYSGEYGISKNPESFASEAYRIYFTDKVRGTVMRLSMDGLTPISNHGMKDWFRDKLKLGDKLIGSYDDKKDEYNITIKGNSIAKTVTFREDVKGWVSFKSFTPENAISCANEYYTFKNGNIWKHHNETADRNTFYDQDLVPSTLEVIFNEVPGSVKSFKTVSYEGSQAKVTKETGDNEYFNLADVPGWHVTNVVTNLEQGGVTEFINKEGKWFGYVTGNDVTMSLIGNVSGNYDTEDSSIQGVGRVASVVTSVIYGCMDVTMFNYNSAATIDDGSCVVMVNGCMDDSANNYDAAANTDDGSCYWLGCTQGPLAIWSDQFAGDANFNASGVAGSINFDSNATVDDGSCTPAIYGCTILGNWNYNLSANLAGSLLSDGTPCGSANCMCIPLIYGCTDANADIPPTFVDEMTDINTEDGSCTYSGCTNPIATNYSLIFAGSTVDGPNGNLTYLNGTAIDDGSCTYVGGCMDAIACNYDSAATIDNGSCSYCADNNAVNYDAAAVDYTCVSACAYCNDVASVTITSQTTADVGMSNGEATIEWPASTSSSVLSYNIAVSGMTSVAITPSGNATETHTITGLGTGTYTIYVVTICTASAGNTLMAGAQLPGGNMGTGPNFGTAVTTTITSTPILGCTDDTGVNNNVGGAWGACNYDASANTDDGSCEYTTCTGCSDNTFLEFCGDCWDPINQVVVASGGSAWVADTIPTSCTTLIVPGCMDATAINYDPTATVDDSSCIAEVLGCTDDTLNNDGSYAASNYSGPPVGLANTNDGSCLPYNCPVVTAVMNGIANFYIQVDVNATTYPLNNSGGFINNTYTSANNGYTGTLNSSFNQWYGTPVGVYYGNLVANNFFTAGDTLLKVDVDLSFGASQECPQTLSVTFSIGCNDASADNYTAAFDITDNTQCEYTGCMDATACNYNILATTPDASNPCLFCGDVNATNYDGASCNTGCIYGGCTDSTPSVMNPSAYAATNYDATATVSCGTNNDNECCTYHDDQDLSKLVEGGNGYYLATIVYEPESTGYTEAVLSTFTIGEAPGVVHTASNVYPNSWPIGTVGIYNRKTTLQPFLWVPYVYNDQLKITAAADFNGASDNDFLSDQLPTGSVSKTFTWSVGCKDNSTAVNFDPNVDLGLASTCIAANPGCTDDAADNYDAAFNQGCTATGSANPNDCCCFACETNFVAGIYVVVDTWNDPTTPVYATQITFSFAAVNTAGSYDIHIQPPAGTAAPITTNPFVPTTINNGIASYVHVNTDPGLFLNESTYGFKVTAHCTNPDGDDCGSGSSPFSTITLND